VHPVNSVATSPQQVPLFLAQPEHLQQGLEKTESASEAKNTSTNKWSVT